jgi:pimeloyl-ACP methyl ester carboxylesterase
MEEEQWSFRCGGVVLSGTLSLPAGSGAVPAAILVSGSGYHDRDETIAGKRPFKVIAEFLAARGYAVLRYDDRGVGKSQGCAVENTFQSSVEDLIAAYRSLAGHERVVSDGICLIGHSEGGLVAADAAGRLGVAVVMVAGPAIPLEDLLHRQAWLMSSERGAKVAELQHERAMNEQVFRLVRESTTAELKDQVHEVISHFLRIWPGDYRASSAEISKAAATMAAIVTAPDYRSLLLQSPHEILREVNSPILALFGSMDRQVEAESNKRAFQKATEQNPLAVAQILPGLNHLFQRARTGSITEYESLGQAPDDSALSFLYEWLERNV